MSYNKAENCSWGEIVVNKAEFSSRASIEILTDIVTKIQKYLSKTPCPEVSIIHNAMAKKWVRYLSLETRKKSLDLYQRNINDVLGSGKLQRSELDTSAPLIISSKQDDIHVADVEIESFQDKYPDAFFTPIAEGNTNDLPT